MRYRAFVFSVLAAAILGAMPLAAQELRSMIFGWVRDPQSMPVAGANVTITNINTGTSTIRKTNETGYYEANLLLSGDYEVSVDASGFKRSLRRGITLPVGTRTQIEVKLEIGAVSESVAVTADAPLLETNAVSSGRIMDSRTLSAVPTQNRNAMLLARWAPGVQTSGVNELASVYNTSTNQYGHVAGRAGGNEWSVDGMPNLGIGRQAAEQPFTDSVEEFKVETSAFDASVGHTLGLSVSMKTKSGTNALHGTLAHVHWQQRWQGAGFFVKQVYYRNIAEAEARGDTARAAALRAQDKQPSGHSNNYGATIGGPVVIPRLIDGRNKLFFFFAFNGPKDIKSTPPGQVNRTIPTLANRQGDFSQLLQVDATRYQIHDPLSIRPDPARPTHFIRTPMPGNLIPASRIANPGYATYAGFLPTPNNDPLTPATEPRNNYLAVGLPSNAEFKSYTNRIDYNPSEKHRFFGRWGWHRSLEPRNDWTYESAPGLHDQFFQRTYRNAIVDWTFVPSASTVLDVAVSVTETLRRFDLTVPFQYKPSDVGLPAYVDQKAGGLRVLPMMSFTGYESLGQNPTPSTRLYMPSIKAEVSHVRGQHTIRAGFDARHAFHNGGAATNSSGNFSFTNAFLRRNDDTFTPAGDLGLSWAAFMMGLPDGLTIATDDTFAVHSPYYGWFVQDNWRLTPKLSLNLGLRMEYEQGPTERYNRILGYFDPSPKLPFTDAVEAA